MIEVQGKKYELIKDYRAGFEEKSFKDRYTDILMKYDFIVGDWGYEQLRLKGFYDDQNPKATFDTKFSTCEDYLYEYCNFGCRFFIVKQVNN